MRRTGVRRRRATLVVVVMTAFASAASVASARGTVHGQQPRRTYVVRDGDTLWSIALRLSPGGDPRPLVDALAAVNHVEPGVLVPGRTLSVPDL